MDNNATPKIPQSVIESLARATLAAMRREQERSSGSEVSGYGKITDNEEQTRPAQKGRARKSEKVL